MADWPSPACLEFFACFNRGRCRCTCYRLDNWPSFESNGHMGLRHESLLPLMRILRQRQSNFTANFAQNNNKAIFPLRGFEKVLGWRVAWLTDITELYFERNFTEPTIVIRILLGHIACVFVFVGRWDFRCRAKLILITYPIISEKAVKRNN